MSASIKAMMSTAQIQAVSVFSDTEDRLRVVGSTIHYTHSTTDEVGTVALSRGRRPIRLGDLFSGLVSQA